MLLRMVRDGGRGVLWSCASDASCARSAALAVLSFFPSGVMLFVRLCLLPTRLIRRIQPMNRRLPFSSPSSGGTPGTARPWASLDRSLDDARPDAAVELFLARCTSSTLADAERGFELARLLGVVGRR